MKNFHAKNQLETAMCHDSAMHESSLSLLILAEQKSSSSKDWAATGWQCWSIQKWPHRRFGPWKSDHLSHDCWEWQDTISCFFGGQWCYHGSTSRGFFEGEFIDVFFRANLRLIDMSWRCRRAQKLRRQGLKFLWIEAFEPPKWLPFWCQVVVPGGLMAFCQKYEHIR